MVGGAANKHRAIAELSKLKGGDWAEMAVVADCAVESKQGLNLDGDIMGRWKELREGEGRGGGMDEFDANVVTGNEDAAVVRVGIESAGEGGEESEGARKRSFEKGEKAVNWDGRRSKKETFLDIVA